MKNTWGDPKNIEVRSQESVDKSRQKAQYVVRRVRWSTICRNTSSARLPDDVCSARPVTDARDRSFAGQTVSVAQARLTNRGIQRGARSSGHRERLQSPSRPSTRRITPGLESSSRKTFRRKNCREGAQSRRARRGIGSGTHPGRSRGPTHAGGTLGGGATLHLVP